MDDQDYPDDKDIIAGLKRGDRWSEDDLVLKYRNRLLLYLERARNVPWADAQDLLQIVFGRILSNPELIRPGTDRLDRFLFTACKNAAIDYHRHRKTEQEHFAEIVEELSNRGEISDPTLDSPNAFPQPHIVLLRQSRSGLDRQKRQVLTMWTEGLPDKEVAEILSENEGTIRQRRRRALEEVRERYLNQLNNQPLDSQEKIRRKLKLD